MTLNRPPIVACIGIADWDRLIAVPRYPEAGGGVSVDEEVSTLGGTTTNTAVALARLGARIGIATTVGDDERGRLVRRALEAEGVDTQWLTVKPGQRTSLATVIVSQEPLDRTVFWERGAQPERHDQLDIAGLFGSDVLIVDIADMPLRRFLLDLPAHTVPTARMLGTLTHLADHHIPDAFDLALRHDVIVSNERDLLTVSGTWTLGDAIAALQNRMRGQTLRAALITRGDEGCRIVTESNRWQIPAFRVEVVDPTGAGDAFVAGVAWGMAQRWPWPETGRFANAVGALACRALGAQASLPTISEVEALLAAQPSSIDS